MTLHMWLEYNFNSAQLHKPAREAFFQPNCAFIVILNFQYEFGEVATVKGFNDSLQLEERKKDFDL